MVRHVKYAHENIRNFSCPNDNCDYIAAQSFDIKKHLRICTNDMLGSFGEVSIKKVLTKLGINFRFDISYELMGDEGKYLRWDFVIPTDDDPLFIEYDGRQHLTHNDLVA